MRYTFRATRRFAPLGLYPGDAITIDEEHPAYFCVERHLPASYGLILGGLLGGELEDPTPSRTAAETTELVRLVAGLPRPTLLRPPLRLLP